MKKSILGAAFAAAVVASSAPAAFAGPVESACLRSGREAASRSLCGCIQQIADQTLNRRDQRRAAKFFRDPDLAHTTWISQSSSDDAFWDRYKQFGAMSEAYCSR